jgi:DNA-binding IclR family transcriptional regulator
MKPMTSLIKALDLISLLSNKEAGMRMTELAEAMNQPRSTLARSMNTLISYGLVEKKGPVYYCGATFDSWAQRNRHSYWTQRYRNVLGHIAEQTGELVLLGLLEGNGVIHLDYIESDHVVRVAPAPFTRHPLEFTAQGKLSLSRRPDLMEGMDKPDLLNEINEIKRTGVAWNREKTVRGMIAMACPGFTNRPTEPMLVVAWPSNRFTEEKGVQARAAIQEALEKFRPENHDPGENMKP